MAITKEEALKALRDCLAWDPEVGHAAADDILVDLIDDPAITEAYNAIDKWYA